MLRTLAALLHIHGAASVSDIYNVLALLYRQTGGPNWKHNRGWLTGDPCVAPGWISSSYYDCYSGELKDELQPVCCELVSLTDTEPELSKLDLFDNNLVGTIPPQLFSESTHLKVLVLDDNHLSGTIPSEIGLLYRLNVLWLQYNSLEGAIPTEMAQLTNFVDRGCYLQNNSLSYCPSEWPVNPDTELPTVLPPQCLADGPVSSVSYLGPFDAACANRTQFAAVTTAVFSSDTE